MKMGATSGTHHAHKAAVVMRTSSSRETPGGPRGGHVAGGLQELQTPSHPARSMS